MTFRAPAALLKMDSIVVKRPTTTVDDEGSPTGNRTVVSVTRGTWSQLSMHEKAFAGTRGTIVDAALALTLGSDVQAGDFVAVRGLNFEVVAADDRRIHRRVLLRAITVQ